MPDHRRSYHEVKNSASQPSAANSFAFGTPSFHYGDDQLTPLRPRTIRLGLRHHF